MTQITQLPIRAKANSRSKTAIERSLRRAQFGMALLMLAITWLATHTQEALGRVVLVTAFLECLALTASRFRQSPLIWIHRLTRRGLHQASRWLLSRLPAPPALRADALPPRDTPSPEALEGELRPLLAALRDELESDGMTPLDELTLPELALELLRVHWPARTAHVVEAITGWPRVAVLSEHGELVALVNRLPDGQFFNAHGTLDQDELGTLMKLERLRLEIPRGRLYARPMVLEECDLIAACLPWLPSHPLAAQQHRIDAWFNGGAANEARFLNR